MHLQPTQASWCCWVLMIIAFVCLHTPEGHFSKKKRGRSHSPAPRTSVCDGGFSANLKFVLDISLTERDGDCDDFNAEMGHFLDAMASVATTPTATIQLRDDTREAEILVSLADDICLGRELDLAVLVDTSTPMTADACAAQQTRIADTVLSIITGNDDELPLNRSRSSSSSSTAPTIARMRVAYIEFGAAGATQTIINLSDDADADGYYRAIVNRAVDICTEPFLSRNRVGGNPALAVALRLAMAQLQDASTRGDRVRDQRLLVFSNTAVDGATEEAICSQWRDLFLQAPPSPPPVGGGGGGGQPPVIPPLPAYVELLYGSIGSEKYRIVVDFTQLIGGQPRITLPVQFLPVLPYWDDEVIFPNNFCGLRVIRASRFLWLDNGGQALTNGELDFPYNYVPEQSSVNALFGFGVYAGGIEFTGPMGACENSGNWYFPWPFTDTNVAFNEPLKLVIELEQGSEIEFLNHNVEPQEALDASELFKEVDFDAFIEFWNEVFDDGFQEWVEQVCEDDPGDCPDEDEGNDGGDSDVLMIHMGGAIQGSYLGCLEDDPSKIFVIPAANANRRTLISRAEDELLDTFYEYMILPRIQNEICETRFSTSAILSAAENGATALGKKRCTKGRRGRKFCVQRVGFLHWKFGWEP